MNKDSFILGNGVIGHATAKALDIPYFFDLKGSNITLEEASKKLFCVICLPTLTDEKGRQDESLKVIRDYVKQLKGYGGRNIFIIRSTVIPGTAKSIAEEFDVMVGSAPEFLSEDTWEKDIQKPRMSVIGANDVPTRNAMRKLLAPLKGKVHVETDTTTAETLKYAFNTFAVTKIVFANQLYDICEVNGADYEAIRMAFHKHPWGTKEHLKVIHKGGRGGGGRCFPKDLKAFAKYSSSDLLKEVDRLNDGYLRKSRKK